MRTLLYKIFIKDWPRKVVSLILALIIWIFVNHSITSTKTVHNVPIKIVNLPPGKTVKGLQDNSFLQKKISLTLTGNKAVLDALTGSDLEVVIDATGKGDEWIVSVEVKDLVCLNPDIDIQKSISRVTHPNLIIKLTKLTTQKIPILITEPVGRPPKGYQYLDISPYFLYVTVKGPYEPVSKLKVRGIKLTYNLSDIDKTDLKKLSKRDEVYFPIPDKWKKLTLSQISENPITIDDPQAKNLRIHFAKKELLKIKKKIPIYLFFPPEKSKKINPKKFNIAINELIAEKNGLKILNIPLFAKGVSSTFLDAVEGRIQIVVIIEEERSMWHAQFIYPHELEDRYISKVIANNSEHSKTKRPELREEDLRNQFRKYMTSFRLYTRDDKKLSLDITRKNHILEIKKRSIIQE